MAKKTKELGKKIAVTQHRFNKERGKLEEYIEYLEPWQIENLKKVVDKRSEVTEEKAEDEPIESEQDE